MKGRGYLWVAYYCDTVRLMKFRVRTALDTLTCMGEGQAQTWKSVEVQTILTSTFTTTMMFHGVSGYSKVDIQTN